MDSLCVSCKKPTTADEKAMACDVYNNSEHVGCLRHCDKLSEELYEALKGCRSRALLYVCTRCRARGSVIKRLHEYEVERARAEEQRLASAQRIDELRERLSELHEERRCMLERQASLEKEVQVLNKQLLDLRAHGIPQSVKVPVSIEPETVITKQTSVEKKATKQDESNEESASSSDSSQDSHNTMIYLFKKTGKRSPPTRFQVFEWTDRKV